MNLNELKGLIQTQIPIIIPCPDFASYPKPLIDQSTATLEECPHCNNKMWLSKKKKELQDLLKLLDKEIFIGCYPCVLVETIKTSKENEMNGEKTDFCKIELDKL